MGALRHLEWLLARHPALRVTLFVTADWMQTSPAITRRLAAAVPYLRDRIHLAEHWPAGTMRLDRHPEFVRYLKNLPRTEVALHGLHHLAKGRHISREFENARRHECASRLKQMIQIFRAANLDFVPGLCPPGWSAPRPLLEAMLETGLRFIASARDILTPVTAQATTNMSGLRGVSMLQPETICHDALLHIPTNWQATSSFERAHAILENGGLLSIKAHIVKNALGHISADGLDGVCRDLLHDLFRRLELEFADTLWWTSMGEIELQCRRT